MKPTINYDFSEFNNIINAMRIKPTQSTLNDLRNELNRFFKDAKCESVLFTINNDKLFFGMRVIPNISGEQAVEIIQGDTPYIFRSYDLEIDSRLFDPMLHLSTGEILAIILHEIGHVVKDSEPVNTLRKDIDIYLMKNNENIKISDSIHYMEILAFGIKDSIQKITSMFENPNDIEIAADEFVVAYGFGDELVMALKKIVAHGFYVNREVNNKLITMTWVLRLYRDVSHRRIAALRAIKKSKTLTPSKLEIKELNNLERRLNRIDDDILIESVIADIKRKYSGLIDRIRIKGLRSVEEDYYEYNMRARNIEDENEALQLVRSINTHISILDDYISSAGLGEDERVRWSNALEKFTKLREELSKKSLYKDSFYGAIVVNYPDIKEAR